MFNLSLVKAGLLIIFLPESTKSIALTIDEDTVGSTVIEFFLFENNNPLY